MRMPSKRSEPVPALPLPIQPTRAPPEQAEHAPERSQVLEEFSHRDLVLRGHELGQVDFPSIREGREVFLCWERSETSVEYWRELEEAGEDRFGL